jgi:hypothetical protein
MNERIKQLIEHATTEEQDGFRYFDKKKFAELIVRECIELNRQELSFSAFARMLDKYSEHFGVE